MKKEVGKRDLSGIQQVKHFVGFTEKLSFNLKSQITEKSEWE